MPRLLLHHNRSFPRGRAWAARRRHLRNAIIVLARWFQQAWSEAFPTPPLPNGPGAPPLRAKGAQLREGALLSESIDAVAKKQLR